MDDVEAAAEALREAGTAVALTGAGISVPSGVPAFRGEGGIWNEYDPGAFHVRRLRRDPGGFWADWLDLRADLLDAEVLPNPGHRALADLSAAGHLDAVVTQNIDGLQQQAAGSVEEPGSDVTADSDDAGTQRVVELHGNGRRAVCRDCGQDADAAETIRRARAGELPPRCESCDGVLEPDVVLFGERLPADELARAERYAEDSDAFLVAGSSLTVEPAASLPMRAARSGATLLVVDLEATSVDSRADFVFREDVTDALPALRNAALE
jgi:NAD-dependent deacetylase